MPLTVNVTESELDSWVPARMLLILEVAGHAASEVKTRATKTKACFYINIYYGVKKNSAYDIITVNRVKANSNFNEPSTIFRVNIFVCKAE